tara:strand:+ start:1039 stop:1437 length:399 start_codon:yes stop_codon:yes gene_type:complete
MANYCRSPVAEAILRQKFNGRFHILSAGISPIARADMDIRSRNYLKDKGLNVEIHTPKRISKKIVKSCEIIFALDPQVLFLLNNKFKKYQNKIRLLNSHRPDIKLNDPFSQNEKDYKIIMSQLETVCLELDL